MSKYRLRASRSADSLRAKRTELSSLRRKRLLPPGISALLALLLSACSGGSDPIIVHDSPIEKPVAGNLLVDPSDIVITEGQTRTLRAMLGGSSVGASQATWSVSPSHVASIDNYGVLTALNPGEATVTARYTSMTASSTATVWAIPHAIAAESDTSLVELVGRGIPDSLAVKAISDEGIPVPGVDVTFQVISGEGVVSNSVQTTGSDGIARTYWNLGTGAGLQEVRASAGSLGTLTFRADALPDYDSAVVQMVDGNGQVGEVGTFLPIPLKAFVADQYGNPLPGLGLNWSFTGGGGVLGWTGGPQAASPEVTSPTDGQGITEVFWKLGTVAGPQQAFCAPPTSGTGGSSGQGSSSGPSASGTQVTIFSANANPGEPASVRILPVEVFTVVGHAEPLSATVQDAFGNQVEGSTFIWSTDESGVVSVDQSGNVMGVSLGTASVYVESVEYGLRDTISATTQGRQPAEILVLSGDDQFGQVTSTLPVPVQVQVKDQVGAPVGGVQIHWTIPQGTGYVADFITISDLSGLSENIWTLGTTAGTQGLQAMIPNVGSVAAQATAAPGDPVTIEIAPQAMSFSALSVTAPATIHAADAFGNTILNPAVEWSSDDPAIFTVDPMGVVTSVGMGSAHLVASLTCCQGADTVAVTVTQAPHTLEMTPLFTSLEIGETRQYTVIVRDAQGSEIINPGVVWTSTNTAVAQVDASGKATAAGAGSATIRATLDELSDDGQLTVLDPQSPLDPPSTVQNVSVTSVTDSSVTLGWTQVDDGSGQPAKYALRMGSPILNWGVAYPTEITVGGSTIGAPVEYTWMGLESATGYEFQMVSYRGTLGVDPSFGGLSNKVSATTSTVFTNPGTVDDLQVVETSGSTVTLRWTQVHDGGGQPAKYAVRYGTPTLAWGNGYPTEVSVTGTQIGAPLEYTFTGLESDTPHEFRLVTYRGILMVDVSFGGLSNTASGTTDTPSGTPGAVSTVRVSPSSVSLTALGEPRELSASAEDSYGNPVPGTTIEWASLNSSVASVTQAGLVEAQGVGTTKIVATAACCEKADTVAVQVAQVAASVEAFPDSVNMDRGTTQQFTSVVKDHRGNVIPSAQVNWSSTNAGVVSLSQAGLATAVAEGTAVLRATSGGVIDVGTFVVENPYAPPPPSDGQAFFSDDFESGDRSKGGGSRSFSWGSAASTAVTTKHPRTGSYSMQFTFDGGGSTSDAWAEQRFSFDPITGPAEIWIEYYVYYADGTENPSLGPAYYSRNMIGDSDGHKIGRLWGGNYSNKPFTAGFSAETGDHPNGSDEIGPSYRRSDGLLMSASAGGLIPGFPGVNGSPQGNLIRGSWMRIREHYKPATNGSAKDGVIQLWINGDLKYDRHDLDFYHPGGAASVYLDKGYLMGWSNAGFDLTTYVFIDDIQFFDNSPGW